uniref:Uncharacterized protein n=1 Tax=Brevundimonas basaltis TaxID=472166 RepID=A0A7W8I1U9_9CAUL|nr:hypothetical protein [Brevundimonas basaltis]
MSTRNGIDQGRSVHDNAGLGQHRVGEAGAPPRQKTARPPSAGGPGAGSGDDAANSVKTGRDA